MTAELRVLVIGGGIGGLSAAIGLKRRGFRVEVWERNLTSSVYHVGIIVQGNFLAALERLGIAEKAVEAGFPYESFENFGCDGSFLYRQPPIRIAEHFAPFLGITRPALHQTLLEEVSRLSVPLHLGRTFHELEIRQHDVLVTSTDGSINRFDLVIGADGVGSAVRPLVAGTLPVPQFTGQGVWRYNIPRMPEVTGLKVYKGKPGMTAGLVPLSEDTMYVFVVSAEPGNPRFPTATLAEELRHRLLGYAGPLEKVRDQVTDPALVVYRPLEGLLVQPPWSQGRVVLLGDAAHASTPHMGQGAALAVEDAAVLAEELDGAADIPAAIARYTARRFPRCQAVVEASRAIGNHEMNPDDGLDVPALFQKVYHVLAQPL